MRTRPTPLLLALLLLCGSVRAAAQVVEVEVRSRRKIAATHGADPSAAGTSIDLTDRVTMPRSLGEVMLEAPGTQLTRTGAMGAFSSVGLRGAAGEETAVLLDEIPLTTSDGGAFDLSLFPAELFDKVEVYRGGAPVWLGAGAIGGVLQLVPRRRAQSGVNASLGAGSFGTYQLQAGSELADAHGVTQHAQLVVRGTRGDYPYRDDRGTLFDPSDDESFRRKNGDFMEASGFHDLTVRVGRGELHLVALGVQRGGGFPGPGSRPTPKIRRESSKAIVALAYDLEGGDDERDARKLQLVASGAYGAERFTDLHGQLGTSKQTASEDRSFRAFLRAAGSLQLTSWLESTLVGSYALDGYLPFDARAYPQPETSRRQSGAAALELAVKGAWGPVRFELRPSARLEWSRTELDARTGNTRPYDPDQSLLAPTGRIGAAVELLPGLALSGSCATGVRLPTMFELFGDSGLVLPAIDLKPVASTTYDAGLTVRGRAGFARGRAELRGFMQERRDSISTHRTAQLQVQHENVSSVKQWGAESSVQGSLGEYFDLSGSFTWLETETALAARLPFRPRYTAYARPEGKLRFSGGWLSSVSTAGELSYRSFAFVDDANLAYTDGCLKVALSAALSMFEERLRFSARMDDSADARCFDLVGFPIPGRSLFFTLAYREVHR